MPRTLAITDFAEPIEVIVADLSFISLTLALPPVLSLAAAGAEAIVLIKPQFEVGRESDWQKRHSQGSGGH